MLVSFMAIAQQEDEPTYLFTEKTGEIKLSGFGAPIVGFCSTEDEFGVMVGGGGAVSLVDEDYDFDDHEDEIGWDVVFVLTPELQVEVNLMKWLKLNFGAGYQFVSGVNNTYITPQGDEAMFYDKNDFNSPIFNLSLMTGSFK